MEQSDLLRYLAGIMEDMGMPYFITGSTATILYGEPRFTNDIDVVARIPENRVAEFCRRFPPDQFYVDEGAARDAVRGFSQFSIIHPTSGLKIDVMIPRPNAFNDSRFDRRRREPSGDNFDVWFASPEDAIIKKLEYYREGGSEKHVRDITGILKISGERLDRPYIAKWAAAMGLGNTWNEIQQRAEGGGPK